MTDFAAIMSEISDANKEHGVEVRGGKKYLEVAKRVEIFRKHFGMSVGIVTDIKHLGVTAGEPVVVQASVFKDGSVIATGTAGEVIGSGNVNKASALENAETSAIGRALATLGLHGGEFASLNEMERIGEKPENLSTAALMAAWEQGIMDGLPDDPSAQTLADAYADQIEMDVTQYKQERWLNSYLQKHKSHLRFVEEHSPERYAEVRATTLQHRAQIGAAA